MKSLLLFQLFGKSFITVITTIIYYQVFGVQKGVKYFMTKPKMIKAIPFPKNDHTTIVGQTRRGKTWGALKSLDQMKEGVFLFNTLHTPIDFNSQFVTATGENNPDQVIELLREGRKINFLPDPDIEKACKQLKAIVDCLYNAGEIDCYIVIDEVHLLAEYKAGKQSIGRVSTAGLRYGYKGVFITQRGQNLDKNLLTQTNYTVLFHIKEHDVQYLQDKGIPAEEMMMKINGQKYLFTTYDEEKVEGAFKIH